MGAVLEGSMAAFTVITAYVVSGFTGLSVSCELTTDTTHTSLSVHKPTDEKQVCSTDSMVLQKPICLPNFIRMAISIGKEQKNLTMTLFRKQTELIEDLFNVFDLDGNLWHFSKLQLPEAAFIAAAWHH